MIGSLGIVSTSAPHVAPSFFIPITFRLTVVMWFPPDMRIMPFLDIRHSFYHLDSSLLEVAS